jgi:hypothetical protein
VKLAAVGLPWRLNLSGHDRRSRVARGTISHLRLSFTGPACTAQVNGASGTAANAYAISPPQFITSP